MTDWDNSLDSGGGPGGLGMLGNIPAELRDRAQWCCAGADKAPRNPRTGALASVADPQTWATLGEAVAAGYPYVGFVLTDDDPYAVIDLDNKPEDPATPEEWTRHLMILDTFTSYTERSLHGGFHIWVRGRFGRGAKRDHTEAYCRSRFIICTGDVYMDHPIAERQEFLDALVQDMRRGKQSAEPAEVPDGPQTEEDEEVFEKARGAANGDKFSALWEGRWGELVNQLGGRLYPSQSEADYALLSMLAFYTPCNEQVERLFRASALGQRAKADRRTYLRTSIASIRAAQAPPPPLPPETIEALKRVRPVAKKPAPAPAVMLPPGLVGDMARYFYSTSVRPVMDIALAAAIGLMAGVVGRCYNVSGTGLNQYVIVVARTGRGKDGIKQCIDNLVAKVRDKGVAQVDRFVAAAGFASGQGLLRQLDETPCFLSLLGEFGLTLQQLCDPRASSAEVTLRRLLLDLYSQSGWSRWLRPTVYADRAKNTGWVQAPCVSLLGDATPETFFDRLDADHIAQGLVPRFTVVQYDGPMPALNSGANAPPNDLLVQRFTRLAVTSLSMEANKQPTTPVWCDPAAQARLDEFERHARGKVNAGGSDVIAELWNRAHLKALKLAALVAVGVDPDRPVITTDVASWAVDYVRRDVEGMVAKFEAGDVGTGDPKMRADMMKAVEQFYEDPAACAAKYTHVDARLAQRGFMPHAFLTSRLPAMASYRKHRNGATAGIKLTLQGLLDDGVLAEVPQSELRKFNYSGKAYWMKSS